MRKVKAFDSFEHLEYCVHMGMPDCYPAGMATVLAKDMLEKGHAKILSAISLTDEVNKKQQTIERKKMETGMVSKMTDKDKGSERLTEVQKMTESGKTAAEDRREARRVRMAERAERIAQAKADRFDRKVVKTADFILKMIKRRAARGKSTYTYKAGLRSRSLRKLLNEVMVELSDFHPKFRGKVIRRYVPGCYDYWCGCYCCGYYSKQRHARLDFSW